MFRPIPGYDGLYEVSESGAIRSLHYMGRPGQRILAVNKTKKGYARIVLSKAGEKKSWAVHRLVALAFVPNPDNKPQINHKDGNKENNHFSNLEWATSHENMRHAYSMGLNSGDRIRGEKHGHAKLTESQIISIRQMLANGKNQSQLSRELGIPRTTISAIKLRRSWAHV